MLNSFKALWLNGSTIQQFHLEKSVLQSKSCSSPLPYMWVTETTYHGLLSDRGTLICLSLNKPDTLTGRSEVWMQALSASIIIVATWPVSLLEQILSFLCLCHDISLPSSPPSLLLLTFFLLPFSSHSVHRVMSWRRNPQMTTALALEESILKYSTCAGEGREYGKCFKDWKVRMVNCLSVHDSH